MSTHMTLEDRQIISTGITNGESFGQIARQIGKCTSTVSREVKGHRIVWDKNSIPKSFPYRWTVSWEKQVHPRYS